jgi:hypothetical protein
MCYSIKPKTKRSFSLALSTSSQNFSSGNGNFPDKKDERTKDMGG